MHIKQLIEKLLEEVETGMLPTETAILIYELRPAVERYGKEVARNVRHQAAELSQYPDRDRLIMNIQFLEVDSNP